MATIKPGVVGGPKNIDLAQNVEGPKVEAKKRRAIEPEPAKITVEDILKMGNPGEQLAPVTPRFRFAPSPTGHLHIGGARTALMNFLAAKNMGGEFVLRIEDTDQLRSKPEYTEAIKEGLKWLGIEWKGDIVFQSQRTKRYQEVVQTLLDEGKAYRDATNAVFFKMPEEGSLVVNDRVKGRVTISVTESDGNKDFVIQRSDGSPMFLMANVIDDIDMGITHVIRGDDHLTNAARQVCLFRALGARVPEFYHVPLIHGDDRQKLSKRHGAQSVIDYRAQGYDPKVLVNHLARLGMGFGTDATLTVEELASRFDPLGFSKAPSLLGLDRLRTRGLHHLKNTPVAEIAAEIKNRIQGDTVSVHVDEIGTIGDTANTLKTLSDSQIHALADGARSRASTIMEAIEIGLFVRAPGVYKEEEAKVIESDKAKVLMKKLYGDLEKVDNGSFKLDVLNDLLEKFNDKNKATYKSYGNILRFMLTGSTEGLPLHHTMVILGKEETLKRLGERIK